MRILQTLLVLIQIQFLKPQSNSNGIVYLSKSQIELIDNQTFLDIRYINKLYLKANRINSLDSLFYYLNKTDTSNLTYIDLSYNLIQSIYEQFPAFEKLDSLDISYNKIESLGSKIFENLKKLTMLNLYGNRLKNLQSDCFVGLYRLIIFDLGENQIESIEETTFSPLMKVEWLNLLKNKLVSLNEFQFRYMQQLKTLIIGSNKLSKVITYAKSFLNLTNLIALNLPSNDLETKDLEIFGIQAFTVQILDLSFNHIDRIVSHSFSKLFSLFYLKLTQSRIEIIEDYSFDYLKNLGELDLESNRLKNLTKRTFVGLGSLVTLQLSNNLISIIEPGALDPLVSINKLYLQNNLISLLPEGLFRNQKELQLINLSENFLKTIESGCFSRLSNLNALFLSDNQIASIEKNAFANSSVKISIDLSMNNLHTIHSYYFEDLVNLVSIDLSKNSIDKIESNSFKYLNYEKIILNHNYIWVIEDDIKVSTLDLNNNFMDELTNFGYHCQFDTLSVEFNLFRAIREGSLSLFADNLIELSLANNKIETIEDNLFSQGSIKTSNVKILKLHNNQICSLKFLNAQFSYLTYIDLTNNLIERLTFDDFKDLAYLRVFNISRNPIRHIQEYLFSKLSLSAVNISNILDILDFETVGMNKISSSLESWDLSLNNYTNFKITSSNEKLKIAYFRRLLLNKSDEIVNFDIFPNLKALDISENYHGYFNLSSIFRLRSLKYLDLNSMNLSTVENFRFVEFTPLVYLNLSRNSIKSLYSYSFNCFGNQFFCSIEKIDLSFNLIEFIERETFFNLDYLLFLDLSNNLIQSIEFGCVPLENLYLSNNLLRILDSKGPYLAALLSNMFSFDLSFNFLTTIDLTNFFNDFNYLLHLNLAYNKLEKLEDKKFSRLYQLQNLNLERNSISIIEPNAFANLDLLENLNLHGNRLSCLDSDVFKNLYQMRYLNLSSNFLQYIDNQLFSSLDNLIELDLSSNVIKAIEANSFKSLSKAKRIYLNSNLQEMKFMGPAFSGLDSIIEIFIDFQVLNNTFNTLKLKNSVEIFISKRVYDVFYYRTVSIQYDGDDINCMLVIDFLRANIQVNLRTDYQFLKFIQQCGYLNLYV